jgi:choline dehydrogenase
VIGSGPGGATIATRLALNNFKVLLIEAGPDYDDGDTRTPAFWPLIELNPLITAEFNPYLYSEEDNITIEYPRGITLGGSSQINAMIAMTANSLEWDYIAQVTNDPTWNHENIQNNYQTLVENCQFCSNNQNKQGWLNISIENPENFQNPVLNSLLENVNSFFKFNENILENNSYDCWSSQPQFVDQNQFIRSGAYKRIKNIQSIKSSHLHVWTNSFVTKLIIDPNTKQTLGVQYINGSNLYKANLLSLQSLNSNQLNKSSVYAKREVIISGGQWMTPQLLQLSGIGDRNLLNKFNIPIIQHLPGVGKNQQDRNEIPFIIKLKPNFNLIGNNLINCTFNTTPNDPCLFDYLNNPSTSLYSSILVLFIALHSTQPILKDLPDTSLLFTPFRFTGFRQNWVENSFSYPLGTYLTLDINNAHNLSNLGTVQIQSTNAFDVPLIQLNHFKGQNEQIEINRIIENIRFLRTLFSNSPFSQYIDYEDLPGSNITTDEQLTQFIKDYVWGHHACCTNKMGDTSKDPLAVVNSNGEVKGIENLRICDISIFPKIPSYYPMLSIATACEKIADEIIKKAKN